MDTELDHVYVRSIRLSATLGATFADAIQEAIIFCAVNKVDVEVEHNDRVYRISHQSLAEQVEAI